MKRDLLDNLHQWRDDPIRVPLILRGARQVGKSWLVSEFGKSFANFIAINFDKDNSASEIFTGKLDVNRIVERIELYAGDKIKPGKTLLFLDEIQECPQAFKMLRYFKEEKPELHVVAAGSLLDFLIEEIGVPVGRVQFMHLYPLSFGEFLTVNGRNDLRDYIKAGKADAVVHNILVDLMKNYMWLGGMPAVIATWQSTRDAKQCQLLQSRIIEAYIQDFEKYARKSQIDNVEKIFSSIPKQLGKKFKFTTVDRDLHSKTLNTALTLLIKAGVAYKCFHASGQAVPLMAERKENKFKVFLFDIGLAQKMSNLSLKEWITQRLDVKYLGSMAEQLVAQEYIAYTSITQGAELYYWHKEGGSNAEIDFLFAKDGLIVPVEVKAGMKGGLKSMHVFLDSHANTKYGLKISQNIKIDQNKIKGIAFYDLEGWLSN